MVRRGKAFVINSKANTERNHNMYSEKTLRRRANNIGYKIVKGFTRFYNRQGAVAGHETGYSVIDLGCGYMVGGHNDVYFNLWTLKDVEEFLQGEYLARGLAF